MLHYNLIVLCEFQSPVEEPWYHNEISRTDAAKLLTEDGDYLVRFSTNEDCYVLTAMCNREPKHLKITQVRSRVLCSIM